MAQLKRAAALKIELLTIIETFTKPGQETNKPFFFFKRRLPVIFSYHKQELEVLIVSNLVQIF